MPTHQPTRAIAPIPLILGLFLWGAGTAFLLEEAIHAGRYDVATLATPILTAATVASACLAHLRFASFRLIGGTGFALLALLGSVIMATGTLGRLAEAKDTKEATLNAGNRTYGNRTEDLKTAKADAKRECTGGVGKRCETANARVDALTKELAGIVVRSTDPKAESIGRLATLLGWNGDRAKVIVAALDPVLLPLFLEFGSVGFFAGAFRHRQTPTASNDEKPSTVAVLALTQAQALRDFRKLREVGSQQFLADRYGVDKSTVSRWLQQWETEGHVARTREGKERKVLALPAPEKRRLGHMTKNVEHHHAE